jgi:hypothetical protein
MIADRQPGTVTSHVTQHISDVLVHKKIVLSPHVVSNDNGPTSYQEKIGFLGDERGVPLGLMADLYHDWGRA